METTITRRPASFRLRSDLKEAMSGKNRNKVYSNVDEIFDEFGACKP